ncbi:MAG: hypothetical protein H6737_12535 [Alphaproteobacteria bacterium]|nr:hypothetical protein [Alphaproteobacteria bacterium]
MAWGLVFILGSWGAVMGLVTSLVGVPPHIEPLLWLGAYVVWIPVILWRRAEPFQTGLAASLVSGFLVGPIQAALLGLYRANNPWYADAFTGSVRDVQIGMVAGGVVAGFVFGLFVGGLAWLAAKVTGRTSAAPAPQAR